MEQGHWQWLAEWHKALFPVNLTLFSPYHWRAWCWLKCDRPSQAWTNPHQLNQFNWISFATKRSQVTQCAPKKPQCALNIMELWLRSQKWKEKAMCSRATGASEKTRPGLWSGQRRRGDLYPISVVTNISSDKEWLITGGEGEKVNTRFSKFF